MPKDNISATDADQHRVGIEMMQAVYGDGPAGQLPAQLTNPFLVDTVDHLFAEIWNRPGLSVRDRRLMVLGATAALGRSDLVEIQVLGALRNQELDADQLQEAVLHLAYYVGWPNATAVSSGVSAALRRHEEEQSGA